MTKKEIKARVKELLATSKISDIKVSIDNRYIEVYVLTNWGGDAYSLAHYRYYQHKLLSVKGDLMFHEIIAMSNLFEN